VRYRHLVSGLLILLFAITYIDRVCISVAGSERGLNRRLS
jgi:hypothetical protein